MYNWTNRNFLVKELGERGRVPLVDSVVVTAKRDHGHSQKERKQQERWEETEFSTRDMSRGETLRTKRVLEWIAHSKGIYKKANQTPPHTKNSQLRQGSYHSFHTSTGGTYRPKHPDPLDHPGCYYSSTRLRQCQILIQHKQLASKHELVEDPSSWERKRKLRSPWWRNSRDMDRINRRLAVGVCCVVVCRSGVEWNGGCPSCCVLLLYHSASSCIASMGLLSTNYDFLM